MQTFDQASGGPSLEQLGEDVKSAQRKLEPTTLQDLFSITGPKRAVGEVVNPVKRVYDAAAQNIVSTPDAAPGSQGLSKLYYLLKGASPGRNDQQ